MTTTTLEKGDLVYFDDHDHEYPRGVVVAVDGDAVVVTTAGHEERWDLGMTWRDDRAPKTK